MKPWSRKRRHACKIELPPLTLRIGTKRSALVGTFVPDNAQPTQIVNHGLRKLGTGALWVQVFVAKNERPLLRYGAAVRRPKSAGVSQVQKPGR